jgi:hypothetical protein
VLSGISSALDERVGERVVIIQAIDQGGLMAELLNLVMLICASLASLAFGIFAAYGILRVTFALMRPRPSAPAVAVKPSPEMAQLS